MPKTKKSEKFPRMLYVTLEEPETGDEYFLTHEDIESVAEIGGVVEVAEYQRVGVKKVHVEVKVK